MENILSLISEYNPFHCGHLYHLEKSIKLVNPKYKVAIISGNFVQRGEPSIINKWEKAKIALHYGFDLILELPTIYAISSAENFAQGAIKIAKQIGTTHLSFGSEIGDINSLLELSDLINNSKNYINKVKEYISNGFSYPKSQELAIKELFSSEFKGICKPNNILGLEYLKSIKNLECSITPLTIKRNDDFISSSQIRQSIRSGNFLKEYVPKYVQNLIVENKKNGNLVYSLKVYEKEIIYTIRKMSFEEISSIPDVPENTCKKIINSAGLCNTLEELISKIKNKSITQARIQRILLYILLNITKQDMEISKQEMPYIRVLGISENGKKLLSTISNQNQNVITSLCNYEKNCKNKNLLKLLDIDKFATDVYTLAYEKNSKSGLDYTTRVITNP